MFLVDTNVFLEILLMQDKKESCKKFMEENAGNLCITDFSLHSIGVVLFRYGKEDILEKFIEDMSANTEIFSLPMKLYGQIVNTKKKLNLDFDDAYQYSTAKYYGLNVVTMDHHFGNVKDVNIVFI